MPYGTPISNEDRIIRHQTLYGYGESPPATRLGMNQIVYTQDMSEETKLAILVGGVFATYIFVDFILPRLMDR